MAFFSSAVGVLQTLVIALGAGLGIWGVINLMEGYGNDNPGAKEPGTDQADGHREAVDRDIPRQQEAEIDHRKPNVKAEAGRIRSAGR